MNWLEKHRKKIEDMKMPQTIITVSSENTYIPYYKFRGNKDVKEIRLHNNILYIERTAFRNCSSLEKINIPPKVNYLHEETFKGCVSLKEIIVQNPEPPICIISTKSESLNDVLNSVYIPVKQPFFNKKKGEFFEGVNKVLCIISVPKGSLELYKKAKEWKDFKNILEI